MRFIAAPATIVVLVTAVVTYAQAPGQATGSIAGCIMDATGRRLPGVTVVATGESARHTTEANTTGCYEIKAVTPGPYRVTARLVGFNNVTRDNVAVAGGSPTSLDLTMSISPICECVRVTGSLAQALKEADAVLHLRIAAPTGRGTSASIYYRHSATVLHAIKAASDSGTTVALLQNQRSGASLPYDADQELVAFLRSVPGKGYTIINGDPGLVIGNEKYALVFLVRDGQIVDAPTAFSRYIGTTVDSFMYELRAGAPK